MSRSTVPRDSVDLYWLPLGAGDDTHCVSFNGRVYEALSARRQGRDRRPILHSALAATFLSPWGRTAPP